MKRPQIPDDWGEASVAFDSIKEYVGSKDLTAVNEAQTRFEVIDRIIREVLGWRYGQIEVEERLFSDKEGYVDYLLRSGDLIVVVEAKKIGIPFPNPTKKPRLKLNGSVLGSGEIAAAIKQAHGYALDKDADAVIVTNALCWCYFPTKAYRENGSAYVLFPFENQAHPEKLFEIFSERNVEHGSLEKIAENPTTFENRLIDTVKQVDGRVDRNSVADHIAPALDGALYADALLGDIDSLEKCFIATDNRSRYDTLLQMHFADPKPETIAPARRIRKDKNGKELQDVVMAASSSYAPPVTLIIGPVGAGKSTYLRHFQLIAGKDVIKRQAAHWIYINLYEMGPSGDPRKFIYEALDAYLLEEHAENPTDWKSVIEPAYRTEFDALSRGPYALTFRNDRDAFTRKMQDLVEKDYQLVEPYIDKVFTYIAKEHLCVIVLDNVDLYENDELETKVFAEGLALSKRLHCNVIVSIRDSTYARHRTDATFDAYELRKLWLDPPPFQAVLSRRLTYSKKILENRSGYVYVGAIKVNISDLANFFDIVQRSVLNGMAGEFIDAMADLNIRKGLSLITNFLTSGHIEADRAIISYTKKEGAYTFPFQEVFKGSMLAQWRHFREDHAECINVFDARFGARHLQLLRLHILVHLAFLARELNTLEVSVESCIDLFSKCGASDKQIISTLRLLRQRGLIRTIDADKLDVGSVVVITRSGGHQAKLLSNRFIYVEECMFDTAISNKPIFTDLQRLTEEIESTEDRKIRLELRQDRIGIFLNYLLELENEVLANMGNVDHLRKIPAIAKYVSREVSRAKRQVNRVRRKHTHQ